MVLFWFYLVLEQGKQEFLLQELLIYCFHQKLNAIPFLYDCQQQSLVPFVHPYLKLQLLQ